jgi:GxxExxY protein
MESLIRPILNEKGQKDNPLLYSSAKKQEINRMVRIKNETTMPHSDLTEIIIRACFEVVKELGSGFLENVYKNALFIAMKQNGLTVLTEQSYEVFFRKQSIGKYIAVIENRIIVELKSCKSLLPDHQAQLINYLKASGLPVGLLVNFGNQRLEYKRVHHPNQHLSLETTKNLVQL